LSGDFPDEERFGLTNQMWRMRRVYLIQYGGTKFTGVVHGFRSICRNRDGIAVRARFETTIALRRTMIAQNDYNRIYAAAEKQSNVFSGCADHWSQRQLLALNRKP
jgi:hypothetical protein